MQITTASIYAWLEERLSKAAYEVEESDTRNGRLLHIAPKNTLAAPMSIWLHPSGGECDIAFGRAFARELALDDGESLFALMEAVVRGDITESIWGFGPQTFCSKSVITLPKEKATVRAGLWLLYPSALKRTYAYEAYA